MHISATARSACQLRIIMGGWIGEEPSVDTECQSKIMTGGWMGGGAICGHRVPIKDHDEWVDR